MTTTWIVAADASRARVLQVADRERLVEIENLVNPEGRLQNREVTSDAAGRFPGKDRPGGHSSDDETLFAKRVGEYFPKNLSWVNARDLERYFKDDGGSR